MLWVVVIWVQNRGRTPTGVHARVTARLLALATVIWHNWNTGTPTKRSLTADDH